MAKDYVINEAGHTSYPKWVDHPNLDDGKTIDGKRIPKRVLCATPEDEAKLTGKKAEEKKAADWDK